LDRPRGKGSGGSKRIKQEAEDFSPINGSSFKTLYHSGEKCNRIRGARGKKRSAEDLLNLSRFLGRAYWKKVPLGRRWLRGKKSFRLCSATFFLQQERVTLIAAQKGGKSCI